MAKKTDQALDIRKIVTTKKVVIGTDRTLKSVRQGVVSQVFVAKNCPKPVQEELAHYKKMTSFEIINLDMTNEDLGILCKKQFGISVLGVLK